MGWLLVTGAWTTGAGGSVGGGTVRVGGGGASVAVGGTGEGVSVAGIGEGVAVGEGSAVTVRVLLGVRLGVRVGRRVRVAVAAGSVTVAEGGASLAVGEAGGMVAEAARVSARAAAACSTVGSGLVIVLPDWQPTISQSVVIRSRRVLRKRISNTIIQTSDGPA